MTKESLIANNTHTRNYIRIQPCLSSEYFPSLRICPLTRNNKNENNENAQVYSKAHESTSSIKLENVEQWSESKQR